MRKYPCSFMFQQITCIPQVVTITNLLSSSGRPNLPNQTGYTIPSWITQSTGYPSHQDNLVPEPTTHRHPISPSPHLHISVRVIKNYHPKVYVCSINFTVSIPIHGIDSNVVSPISHRGISYLKTHILKTSILIKSHIFRNPPFFTIV